MRRRHRTAGPADEALEALISGREAPEELDDLVAFVGAVRLAATPVTPDDELRRMFDEGVEAEPARVPAAPAAAGATRTARPLRTRGKHMRDGLTTRLAAVSLTAKIALGSAVAVAGVTTAGALLPDEAQVPDEVPVVVEPASQAELDPPADEDAEDGLETARAAIASGADGWAQWVTVENGGTPEALPASTEASEGIETADGASDGRSTEGLQIAEDAIDNGPAGPPAGQQTGEDASGVTPPAGQGTGGERSGVAGSEAGDAGAQAGDAGSQDPTGNADESDRAGERPGR
jgi:hypothetical protein